MAHMITKAPRRFRAGGGLLALLLAIIWLMGCGGGGGITAPLTQPAGSINGHLYLSADQQTLSMTRSAGSTAANGAVVRLQGTPYQTMTDIDGAFALERVPVGAYQLIITHDGHQPLAIPVTVEADRILHLDTTQTAPAVPRKWTVLIYMNADNDLETYAVQDINEMEASPASDQVAVIVQTDRTPGFDTSNGNWTDTRRLRIQHDDDMQTITSPVLETMGEVDMGQPQTAQDFLAWGQQMYPAEHYLFIFWNHGNGWRSRSITSVSTRGISYDDTSGSYIRIVDVPAALTAPAPVDLVAFDACLMQMLEIGYEMRNVCHYVVAAEDDVPAEGYDYQTWLTPLTQDPGMSPKNLAITMQREAWESYSPFYAYVTYSVLDTGEVAGVTSAVDALSRALIPVAGMYPAQLAAARDRADAYTDREYKDLADYAALVKATIPDVAVGNAADAVIAAVHRAVVAEYHAPGHPNAHGLSIYIPTPVAFVRSAATYRPLALAQQTQWDEWLGSQVP